MDQQIKLWHMISAIIAVCAACFTMIFNAGVRVSNSEFKIQVIESRLNAFEATQRLENDKTSTRLDRVQTNINDILVLLQNKQDRQK